MIGIMDSRSLGGERGEERGKQMRAEEALGYEVLESLSLTPLTD